ncbi:MAG: copper resistance CopC family protein [Lapillicoccus sp.]
MADPRSRRRATPLVTAAVLVVIATMAWVVGGASVAAAHDALRSTSPADGATVTTVPAEVVLTFDQPALALGTEVVVTDPSGSPVQDGAPSLVDATVRQRVRGGGAGTYAVRWRVTSVDGHPVSGTFTFTATAASASTSASTPASTPAQASTGVVAATTPTPSSSSSSSVVPVIVAVIAVLLVAAVGAFLGALWRRRPGAPDASVDG